MENAEAVTLSNLNALTVVLSVHEKALKGLKELLHG